MIYCWLQIVCTSPRLLLLFWHDKIFLKPCNLQNGQSYRRLDPIKPFIPLVAPVFWNTGILSHVKINATETRRVFICSWIKFCNFVLDTVLGQSMEKKLCNYVETKILNMDMKFIFWEKKKKLQIHKIRKCLLVYVYESVIFILTFNSLLVHGFYMVIVTRSYARSEKMCVTRASWLLLWVNTAISN